MTATKSFSTNGTYTVILTVTDQASQRATQSQSITVEGLDAISCPECQSVSGFIASAGQSEYRPWPEGYIAGAGTHRATLYGPTGGFFSLYLYKLNGTKWEQVAQSSSSGTNASLTYNGDAGTYTWYVSAQAKGGAYQIMWGAPAVPIVCSNCQVSTGVIDSPTGFQIVSPGTFNAGSGIHRGTLTGPSGSNFDLYLDRFDGTNWGPVAQSQTATSTEAVLYNGAAAPYVWVVIPRTGTGTYELRWEAPAP